MVTIAAGCLHAPSRTRFMNSNNTEWMLLLLAIRAASGQPIGVPKAGAISAPAITILTAVSGALVLNQGPGNASVNLGGISYFKGAAASGETSQRISKSFVITTRFALRVDCQGIPASVQVKVVMSRTDGAASHLMAIDGVRLGTAPQTLEQSMSCGSSSEHRLDVEVPTSTPAGSIGSTVAFLATFRQ
jgi:hypothetical protein